MRVGAGVRDHAKCRGRRLRKGFGRWSRGELHGLIARAIRVRERIPLGAIIRRRRSHLARRLLVQEPIKLAEIIIAILSPEKVLRHVIQTIDAIQMHERFVRGRGKQALRRGSYLSLHQPLRVLPLLFRSP